MGTFVLQGIPWGFKHPGIQYNKDKKIWTYKGTVLPEALRQYQTEDFSYERWLEDEYAGYVQPTRRGSTVFTPHEHQKEDAKLIYQSHAAGNAGFLLANFTGTGKTLSALAGVSAVARSSQKKSPGKERSTLLIVCPKGVIPVWRQTLQSFPPATQSLRPLIVSYHQLNKLLKAPAQARTAKRRRTKNRSTARHGKPTIDWDHIIFDEEHYLKNFPTSTMSMSAVNIAKLDKPYEQGKSPFVVYATATPGSSPLNFAVMSQILSPYLADNEGKKIAAPVPPGEWGDLLKQLDFDVRPGKVPGEWYWAPAPWGKTSEDPDEQAKYERRLAQVKKNQRRDAIRIGKALKHDKAPFIMRKPQDIAGWPEQQLIPLPEELTVKQQPVYEEAWNHFRRFLNLKPKGADPKGTLAEQLRYRQKSSLLKVEATIDHIVDSVNNGNQVFVSCEFGETIDRYREELNKRKIACGEVSGRNVPEREDERIKFQKGIVKVMLCSVVEGVSFHAEETLSDGSKATSADRITYIHDIRQNPLQTIQALGRCHRDGKNSLAYFPYFTDTVDEKIVVSFTNKSANMKLMTGGSEEASEEMENLFRNSAARSD